MLTTPITNDAEARAYLVALATEGKAYHLDDDPADVVDVEGRPVFTTEEAGLLRQRTAEARQHCTVDVFEVLLDAIESATENPHKVY